MFSTQYFLQLRYIAVSIVYFNTFFLRLWRVGGCHELLASLGCDLMEVGQDEVTLRTGKQANRRNIQFVLQALLALFG